jgi:drug/metabolite transporter (DMT)-like permease
MKRSTLWLAVGFIGNGFAQFLQKYLHAAGLGAFQASALIAMYVAGALFAAVLLLSFKGHLGRKECWAGLGVGLCSYAGSFAVLRALGSVPAYVVFPMVVGGPIVLVALFSWLVRGERLSASTKTGILFGLISVALLTLG